MDKDIKELVKEQGNIQLVHKKINLMKLDMLEADFIFYCKKVGEYVKSTTISTE